MDTSSQDPDSLLTEEDLEHPIVWEDTEAPIDDEQVASELEPAIMPPEELESGNVQATVPKKEYKRPKCPHGRERHRCKECGGKGICSHNQERRKCVDCKGSAICAHGRQKYRCKYCDENSVVSNWVSPRVDSVSSSPKCSIRMICPHNKRIHDCVECDGIQICGHKRIQRTCRICRDIPRTTMCEVHGGPQYKCKECSKADLCIHRVLKYTCLFCKNA